MPTTSSDTAVHPYRVEIDQADLDDLQARLARVRWPDELPGAGWDYGVPVDWVRRLVDRWRDGYDWRAHEARLNAHPQFTTTIDGQRVHFLHVRSPEPGALPLICTHGWPMSVFEYLDLIGPLSDPGRHGGDPADAFHLVIPSIPGVAFSGPTTEPGWDTRRVGRAWVELMARLGYDRYGAHGNDGGSQISPEVGRFAPDQVVGVHVTQLFSFPSGDPAEFADMSEEDMAAMNFLQTFTAGGGLAYNAYQSAQPQTLAYALQDSPAGWLAWVGQLYQQWAEPDYVLTNASAYWLTGTIGSSIRRYFAEAHGTDGPTEPTTAPTGVAIFAEDFQSVRRFADRDHANIVSWNHYDRGSHFSPHDAPDLLLDDLRRFFRPLRAAQPAS
jgi:epoxide hydrolase